MLPSRKTRVFALTAIGVIALDILTKRFGEARVVGGAARIGVTLSDKGEVLHTSPMAGYKLVFKHPRARRTSGVKTSI